MRASAVERFIQRLPAMKTIAREGAVDALGAELELLGARRVLLLSSASARRSSLHARVMRQLEGRELLDGGDVPAHSSVALVERLAAQANAHGVQAIVAVGGGSSSDTAKAVALLMAEGGRLADHASRFTPPAQLHVPVLSRPKVPIVSIPCTASGAEVTPSLGIRDADGRKLLFTDPQLASRVVLLDAAANVEVPAAIMLSTGMNGIAHCIEGLYSRERSPLAELVGLDALARFAHALPQVQARPQDVSLRAELLYAAHLSGLVLVNARTALHHAICHAIGSVTGAAHGEANAVMLPHALRFNRPCVEEALARASAVVGQDVIDWTESFAAALGVPRRLRDIGVGEDALAAIARKTMGERGLYFNPRQVENDGEILDLLRQAY
ncbi:iron-containing alcohol dehydrogenase family protein [Ramlibacter rhizophilus]|uniref:Iron-containing alcohol dehydrogenase n=1 Tax=Ramlibacter rhizophilus TaxID=1781167 RepID=A0A4Z0C1L1_9BURK|nr:iron-containing alcohol dehydrogenase [Ramlibacter rhizophilus]TFZ04390.1 iron-containing alcohol dehydrogenase [Ramlibacter rhizophilus]